MKPTLTVFSLVIYAFYWKFFICDVSIPSSDQNIKIILSSKTVFRSSATGLSLLTHNLAVSAKKNKFTYHDKNRLVPLYLCTLILLLSYSPEPNPGPAAPQNDSHYPCGTCDVSVSWSEKGVACDTCGIWFHALCHSIQTLSYENLNEDVSWHCAICGSPNSATVFDLYGIDWTDASSHHDSNLSCTTPTETAFKPHHSSTPSRANQQNKWKNRPLRIININFPSARGKYAEIIHLVDSLKPDIILGCETWLDKDISDNEVIPDIYTLYRKDRNKNGGGVLIAVRTNLKSFIVPELTTDCEIIWAGVKLLGRKTLYLCSYYRPKTSDEPSFNKLRDSLARAMQIPNVSILMGGDFNFPGWDWNTLTLKPGTKCTDLHNKFRDLLHDHNLHQLVLETTRTDKKKGTSNTLDLLITNNPHLVPRVEVIPGLSDHDIPYCEFAINLPRIKQAPRLISLYNKANLDAMRKDMSELHDELDRIKDNLTTEELWTRFKDTLTTSVQANVPQKKARTKTSKPWITAEIRKIAKRHERVYKKKKKQSLPELEKEQKELRRQKQRMVRRSYWDYVNRTLTKDNESSDETKARPNKKFYSFIKHQRSSNCGVAPLKVEGQLVTDPTAKAETLNRQFQSVFSEGRHYTDEEFSAKCKMTGNPPDNILSDIEVKEEGIKKLLAKLNPHKAVGPDKISPRILRDLAEEIAPILTIIYQSSLNTGHVPSDWRNANVAPIFKKGEHYDPANYRPVSLTSIPCKILEHVIVSALMSHLEKQNILRTEQLGFRKFRSCETQLLNFTDELYTTIEKGNQADVIIMDFAKAFDKVNHSLLIHKLKHYGVQGQVLNWIAAFLKDRHQSVIVDGASSSQVSVQSGVPQGSVLGPTLFLAYINDLPEDLSSLTKLFADDTAVYRLKATQTDINLLQEDLQKLETWEQSWDMSFHPGKCTTLPVTRARNPKKNNYILHDHSLEIVDKSKYLGVTLTSDLTWDLHINAICAKANKSLGFLRRNLKIPAISLKESAYKTFVRPILEYACTVWDPHTQDNISKLEAVQRRAARFVVNRYHNTSSVTNMLNQLQWPSLQHRGKVAR